MDHAAHDTAPSIRKLGKGATVWTAGRGDRLLILHGWGLRPETYGRGLRLLAGRGYEVAAPTLGVVGRRWDIDRAVHRVVKTLDHLEWDRTIVVGNSLGGAVAINVAARHPDRVRLLGLVNSVGLDLERGMLGWVLPFRRYAAAANLRALGAFGRNAIATTGALNLAGAAVYARTCSLAPELAAIRATSLPSVVMWGEDDRLLPLEMGRRMAAALGAPLRLIPRSDHDWTVRRPELFARELDVSLRTVLRETERRGGAGPLERLTGRLRAARSQEPPPVVS